MNMLATIDDSALDQVHGGSLEGAGRAFGFGAGVAVTGALALVPGWNRQVPGAPAGFQERHKPVAGPAINRFADGMSPGPLRNLVSGIGAGATAAPQWSFEHGI
jgi:hypothetical protein